jgi:hypothetical protein
MPIHDKNTINLYQFLLLILIILTTEIVVIDILDIPIPHFNPPDKLEDIPLYLYFPSSSNPAPLPITDMETNHSENNPLMSVSIFLQYQGTLSEESKVDVAAEGIIDQNNASMIQGVDEYNHKISNFTGYNTSGILDYAVVGGFTGAAQYNESGPIEQLPRGQFWINLVPGNPSSEYYDIDSSMTGNKFPFIQEIKWYTQGDYYPYLTIFYTNGSEHTIEYPDYKIHVAGSDIIQQEKYTKITTALTIILLVFTVITTLNYIIFDLPDKIQ